MSLLINIIDLFTFYLTLEGLNMILYILIVLDFRKLSTIEAVIKYFLFNAIAGGIILLGLVLNYSIVNSLDIVNISDCCTNILLMDNHFSINLQGLHIAAFLIFFGLFFKISAFPVHT